MGSGAGQTGRRCVVCCFTYKPTLGNLHISTFSEIWRSERAKELRELVKHGACFNDQQRGGAFDSASGILKKDKLFSFSFKGGVDFGLAIKAAARGLPSLMLTAGVIIKNYCFNYSLNNYVGAAGVAVAGIMATSSPLSRVFVPNDSSVQELAQRMFLLTFTYLVPNVVFNILLQAYRAQNRMLPVNIMSFSETMVIGLFSLFAIPSFGADAAWLSNFVVDVLCLIVVLI